MQRNGYYKSKYLITFYEMDDETYRFGFNNVKDILAWQGKPITKHNIIRTSVDIYRSVNDIHHYSTFLLGPSHPLKIYLIDMFDEEDEKFIKGEN